MKSMKTRELVQTLNQAGFIWVRDGEHRVFQNGNVNVYVPHTRECSPAIVRQALKAVKAVSKPMEAVAA